MASKKPAADTSKPLTGPEIIDKMAAEPALDRYFIGKPTFTDEELREFIAVQRKERALWETKK